MVTKQAHRVLSRFLARIGMEFATPEALKEYLKEHPGADPKNHSVKKQEAPAKATKYFDDKEMNLGSLVRQTTKDPDALFKQAAEAHEQQLDWLNRGKGLDKAIGAKVVRVDKGDPKQGYKDVLDTIDYDKPGPIVVIGPMKTKERSKEKVEADCDGDWSYLGDAVRASVAVDSMDQLDDVMDKLRKSGLKVARKPNDRFAKPTSVGYRDIMMNVVFPNGHVGELQLHLKSVLKAKDQGHKFYETVRKIEGDAKKEKRDTLNPDEQAQVDKANDEMKALYNKAWEESQKKTKTAMNQDRNQTQIVESAAEVPSQAKFYSYNGQPAFQTKGKFPKLVTPKGRFSTIYDLEKFAREAGEITRAEFDALR